MDSPPQPPRYFWSDWFSGQSLALLATVFIMLSVADLVATQRLLPVGVKEGNALAALVLSHFGHVGFIVYKLALVAVVVLACVAIDRRDPGLARTILWGGILLMGVIALIHLAIMAGFTSAAVM